MLKKQLRKLYLDRRKSLPNSIIQNKSALIAERFFENFDLSKIAFLHLFLPIEKFNEIDTKFIFEKIRRDFPHVQTLVPRVNFQTNEIENRIFSVESEMKKNVWDIDEPAHDETVATEKLDIVLVPLLCFDRRGFRAGYGKGFYDKFLRNCRTDCLKIGLSFFAPVEQISDVNEFDIKLDFCITPEKVWKFSD